MIFLLSYPKFIKSVPHSPFSIVSCLLGWFFSYLIQCLQNLCLTPLFLLLPLPFLDVPSPILYNVCKICSSLHLSCYCPTPSCMFLLLSYSLFIKSVPHSPFPAIAPSPSWMFLLFSYSMFKKSVPTSLFLLSPLPFLDVPSLISSKVYKIYSSLPFSCYCPSPSWMFLLLHVSHPKFIKSSPHSPFPAILGCSFSYLIQCLKNLFLTPLFLIFSLPFLDVSSLILSNVYKICSSLHLSCYCPSLPCSSFSYLFLCWYCKICSSLTFFCLIAPPLLGCSFSYLIHCL